MQHQLISGALAAYLQKCSVESKKYSFIFVMIFQMKFEKMCSNVWYNTLGHIYIGKA